MPPVAPSPPTPRGARAKTVEHVSRFRVAWYLGGVAAACAAFQLGLHGGLLHRAFWGW